MDTDGRELSERLQRRESIEAQLARHREMARLGLLWLPAIGVVLLALAGYIVIHL